MHFQRKYAIRPSTIAVPVPALYTNPPPDNVAVDGGGGGGALVAVGRARLTLDGAPVILLGLKLQPYEEIITVSTVRNSTGRSKLGPYHWINGASVQ